VLDPLAATTVEVECRYRGYLERQEREIEQLRESQSLVLPPGFDFAALPSLSTAEKEKLEEARPGSVHAASRVPGIKPSSVMILFKHARRLDVNREQDERRLAEHQAQVGQQFLDPGAGEDAPAAGSWDSSRRERTAGLMSELRTSAEQAERA